MARFKKGQSGNPKGRPKKGHTLTDILSEIGDIEDVEINGKKVSKKRALGIQLWQMAIVEKNFAAIKYIYDRIDGTPIQAVEHTGEFHNTNDNTETIKIPDTDERMDKVLAILDSVKGLRKEGSQDRDSSEAD